MTASHLGKAVHPGEDMQVSNVGNVWQRSLQELLVVTIQEQPDTAPQAVEFIYETQSAEAIEIKANIIKVRRVLFIFA